MDFLKSGKLTSFRKNACIIAYFLSFFLFFFQTSAISADYNYTVENGSADLSCEGSSCTINLTDGTILNWSDGLTVDLGATLNFLFGSGSGSVLNNVFGSGTSILGSVFSNGSVFFSSPAGIHIASTASIHAASLIASTLTISSENFLSGNYIFENGSQAGALLNEGTITAQQGGYVALLGNTVHNAGNILAEMGSIVLASGEKMTVSFDANGLIRLAIDEALTRTISESQSAVLNSGELHADGGKILLTANIARSIFDYIVNNTGIIEANSVVVRNGMIEFVGSGGEVTNSGWVVADPSAENSLGGSIKMTGDDISNAGLVRGNDISMVAENDITLLPGSMTEATGTNPIGPVINLIPNHLVSGEPLVLQLYAGRHGNFERDAKIKLRQDAYGDFSAHYRLNIGGDVLSGNLFFDPLIIVFGAGTTLCGGSCVYDATEDIIFNANAVLSAPAGSVTLIADSDHNGTGTVQMGSGSKIEASGDVIIDGSGNMTLSDITAGGNVEIGQNSDVSSIATAGGTSINGANDITMWAFNIFLNGSVITSSGDINIGAVDNIHYEQSINAGSGDITLKALRGSITNGSSGLLSGNTVNLMSNSIGSLLNSLLVSASQINIISVPVLTGDYNGDGAVDGADYVVWRKMLGMSGPGLAADGDLDGDVDSRDFSLFRANFGGLPTSINAAFISSPSVTSITGLSADLVNLFISPLFTSQDTKRKVALFAF